MMQFPDPSFLEDKRKWIQLVHSLDRKAYQSFHENVVRLGVGEMEFRITRKNGEIRWMHESCKMIRDKEGKPSRLEGMITDITERKRTEKSRLTDGTCPSALTSLLMITSEATAASC
jgi:PAS domain S-box-containing protein